VYLEILYYSRSFTLLAVVIRCTWCKVWSFHTDVPSQGLMGCDAI